MSAESSGSGSSGGNSGNVVSIRRPIDEVEKLMTAAQVSELFQCSESKIYKAAVSEELPSFLLWGSLRRFRRGDVEAWLERQRPDPRSPTSRRSVA